MKYSDKHVIYAILLTLLRKFSLRPRLLCPHFKPHRSNINTADRYDACSKRHIGFPWRRLLFRGNPRRCSILHISSRTENEVARHASGSTFPGLWSSRTSIVSVNVQSSGSGDRLASEYAVRTIAARNASSRAVRLITASTIL